MTDTEILKMDFYELCGTASAFMSDRDKINYWRELSK
jgi:hypothetical protein